MRAHTAPALSSPVREGFHIPHKAGDAALYDSPAIGQNVKLMVKLDGFYPCAADPDEQTDWFAMGGPVVEVLAPERVRVRLWPTSDNAPAIMGSGEWVGILHRDDAMEYPWLLVELSRAGDDEKAPHAPAKDRARWLGLALMGLGVLALGSDAWKAYQAVSGAERPAILELSFRSMAMGVMLLVFGALVSAVPKQLVSFFEAPRFRRTRALAFMALLVGAAIAGDMLLTGALEQVGYEAPAGTDRTWRLSGRSP